MDNGLSIPTVGPLKVGDFFWFLEAGYDSERACYPGRRPALGELARRRVVPVKFDVFFSRLLFLLTAAK